MHQSWSKLDRGSI